MKEKSDTVQLADSISNLLKQSVPVEALISQPMTWGKPKIGGTKRNKKRYKTAKQSKRKNRK